MKSDSLWQISVITTPEAEEAVAALLERLFGEQAAIYQVEDSKEAVVTIFSERPAERAFSKREALEAGLRYITDCGLNIGPGKITIGKVPREDWSESWKKYFKTIEIDGALLIKPSWSRKRAQADQAVVVLDPGLSFGTGQHETTRFCLEQIVACRKPGEKQSFLDIGTGSGILAISAAKLGYEPVRAFDFDPAAVRISRANARKNRVRDRVSFTRSDLTALRKKSKTQFDLICANLVATLLVEERDRILNRLRPEGRLVVAGILKDQFASVQKNYEAAGLKLISSETKRGWQSGLFGRETECQTS